MTPINTFPKPVLRKISVDDLIQKISKGVAYGMSETLVEFVSSPEEACRGGIVFINARGEALRKKIKISRASIFVVSEHIEINVLCDQCYVLTEDPLAWYIMALQYLMDLSEASHVSKLAIIADNVIIGANVSIGPGTVVESGCVIGDNTIIGANAFIARDTIIKKGCFLQNNVSIGSVGLGYHTDATRNRMLLPHLGRVIIGNAVVIGVASVIVRGQLNDTVLNDFVRLGNLVNIGHNVCIDSNTVLSSNVCIAGGAKIGSSCNIGIGVNINSKVEIGNNVKIGMGSVVVKSILSGASYFGNPAKSLPTMKSF